MRRYEKPVMQVERYAVNNTICSGCNKVKIEDVVVPEKNQSINCYATSTAEGCFNTASGCSNTVSLVTLTGTYSSNSGASLATWIYRGAKTSEMSRYYVVSGTSGKYDAYPGDYVTWYTAATRDSSEGYHAGPVTTEIQGLYGLSY